MNILLINADQLRHDSVGYRGLRKVRTPNIDKLASRSVVYENAFTPLPVCSPARQSILCGRRPDSFGAQWNYDFMPTPELDPATCWTTELGKKDWKLGYVGRFHVSATRTPFDFGFSDFVNMNEYKGEVSKAFPDAVYTGGWLGCESPLPLEYNRTHWQANKAVDLLKRYTSQSKPWFMWVDFEEPHLPCRPAKPFSEMYDPDEIEPWDGWGDTFENKPYIHRQQTLSWNTDKLTWKDFAPMVARYFGCITQLDDAIGRILDTLEASPARDDTMVIFTSDHGDMCASHSMLDKHYVLYDDIIRVPLLLSRPGAVHTVISGNVMNCLDIPATIRKETGLAPDPLNHGSVLPETAAESEKCPKEVLVTSNGQQFGLYTTRCIRTEKYKYVWNLTDIDELYDLESDPGEKRNLIKDPAMTEVIKQLREKLYKLLLQTRDRFAGNEWMKRQLLEGAKYAG